MTERQTDQGNTSEGERIEILRFSDETKKALEKRGFIIIELTGRSIRMLRELGYPFHSGHQRDDSVEEQASMMSEVAIDPKNLSLAGSNNIYPVEQKAMVAKDNKTLQKEIPDIEMIIGTAADYADLVFTYFEKTKGQRLFGKDQKFCYARTKPIIENVAWAYVGNFNDEGLDLMVWNPPYPYRDIYAVPLIVPASNNK
jgi:hypothetical protein